MVVAVFGANLANTSDLASTNPLPYSLDGVSATVNGLAAPIQYVSQTQLNIQVPYEAGAGPAVLGIDNNGQIAGFQLTVAPAAPGIFADSSGNLAPVAQGGSGILYLAGAGEVANLIETGQTALSSPKSTPLLPVSMTVGGETAFLNSVALAAGQVGVLQVNFTLPPTVSQGVQAVVVTVGGVASPPVNLTVQ